MKDIPNSNIYRGLRILVNAGFWIGLGAMAVFLILIVANPRSIASSGINFNGFVLSGSSIDKESHLLFYVSVALSSTVGLWCIWVLRNILNSLSSNSPFTLKNVKRIQIIGGIVLLQIYLKQGLNYLLVSKTYDTLLQKGADSVLQPRFTLIPEGIVWALCILVIAEIFRVGCVLQHEHDTTV